MSVPGTAPPVNLDPERQKKAKEYARIRRRLFIIEIALTAIVLLVLAFSGLSPEIVSIFSLPVVAGAVVYITILLAAFEVITAPLDYYSGFVLPHRYGLSIEKFGGWLKDELKSKGLGLLLAAGMTALVYYLLSNFSQAWWLITWGIAVVFLLIMSYLAPIIIIPIFIKMKPLENAELKQRLEDLARRAGIRVRGVFTLEVSKKGTTANAALMGLGNTRRIALTDTLIGKYTVEEIEVILAHEMGHHRQSDIPRGFAIQAALLLVGLYLVNVMYVNLVGALGLNGIADIAGLPLLIIVTGFLGLLGAPLTNSYQRRREALADYFALRLTDRPEAFMSMMTKLTDQNLGEDEPPRWVRIFMYDHPSYRERMELARRYSLTHSGG